MFYLLFLIGAHQGCQQDREFRHGGVVLELTGILVCLLLTLVLSLRDLGEDNAFVPLQIRLAQNMVKENTHPNTDGFSPVTLSSVTYAEKKEAGAALLTLCQNMLTPEATQVGSYRGLTLELSFDSFAQEYRLTMIGQLRHTVTLGTDVFGNLQRMDNALESLPIKEQTCREQLADLQAQLETAKVEVQKPFPREEELKTKTARLEELNTLLNLDQKEPEIVDAEPDENMRPPSRSSPQMER